MNVKILPTFYYYQVYTSMEAKELLFYKHWCSIHRQYNKRLRLMSNGMAGINRELISGKSILELATWRLARLTRQGKEDSNLAHNLSRLIACVSYEM